MAETVYMLCAITSVACAALLLHSYRRGRVALILWTSLCFVGLALNNIFLFIDLVVVLAVDLRLLRNSFGLAGVALLLYGMIRSEVKE